MSIRKLTVISFVLCVPLLLEMLGLKLPGGMYTMWVLATPVVLGTGLRFHASAWAALKNRNANMDTLISVGTLTAYTYSVFAIVTKRDVFFEIAAFLIFFILLGQWFEELSKGRASRAIEKLAELQPKTATVVVGGKEKIIKLAEISVGDILKVRPGERIAVDGMVQDGESAIDEFMITGESLPVKKHRSDSAVGGTINQTGTLTYKATKVGKDTMLASIVDLVRRAQTTKAPIQRVADKISSYFVPSVLLLAIVVFNIWYVLIGVGFVQALLFAVAVIIIACPCALGLATPMALMVGTGQGAKTGILIKSGEVLESARNITYVVFDKTGTLTEGKPKVTDVVGSNKETILRVAASLESSSEHPLAQAILSYANDKRISILKISNFKAIEGHGVQAKLANKPVYIGKPRTDLTEYKNDFKALQKQAKTVVVVEQNNKIIGLIAIADKPKKHAKQALVALHKMGYKTIMLTGDNKETANAVAKQVGIKQVFSEVLPQQKLNEVRKLQDNGKVVFVGDGINDAPALAVSDVGIAMGSGTDVAAESGGIILVKNDVRDVAKALRLSQKTFSKIRQNLFWAFAYNVSAIPIAAGVFSSLGLVLNPALAGLAMAFSSVSVVANSLLLVKD